MPQMQKAVKLGAGPQCWERNPQNIPKNHLTEVSLKCILPAQQASQCLHQ
jgi:hypothetical protein